MSGDHATAVEVTAAFVTRNRRNELARALESVLDQDGAEKPGFLEIVVVDDGSTDQTQQMLAERFPQTRVVRLEKSIGAAPARNVAMELASGGIVLCLDDDAWLPSTRTVQQTLRDFDDPRVAVVAMPFNDLENGALVPHHVSPSPSTSWAAPVFIGAAYAVRNDAFRSVGGYRLEVPMYGEEADLSLRLLNAGYVVRLGQADPAQHEPSSVRSLDFKHWAGRRNEIIWVWLSFPAPWHLIYAAGYVLKGIRFGVRIKRVRLILRGLGHGYAAIPRLERRPVSRRAFRLDRRLRRHKALPMREVLADLGPVGPGPVVSRMGTQAAAPLGERTNSP
jgi:GT2 family glycosyltransferase